jgi:hypothetical protein
VRTDWNGFNSRLIEDSSRQIPVIALRRIAEEVA